MPRKTVTRLRKSCGQLAGHSRKQAERVAQAATEKVRDLLPEGQEVVDILHLQLCFGQLLENIRDQLTADDNRNSHELQIDRNLREERDSATKELRERLFQLRDSLDGLFGTGGGAKIFEDAPRIPDDPVALHQLTGHIRDNLMNPQFVMPRPLQQGFKLDRVQSVADFEEPFLQLGDALRQLEDTESNSKYSQSEKDISVDETLVFVGKVARFYEALYALVGFDQLAKRVRRSSHRRIESEVEEPGDEPQEPEESDDGTVTPEGADAPLPVVT